ncbi:MAG: murein transglycosylase [Alphaproteobacteria bacterium]|nr:MAG: murein transglycosylase [Alphaproteobacteria bacterium]
MLRVLGLAFCLAAAPVTVGLAVAPAAADPFAFVPQNPNRSDWAPGGSFPASPSAGLPRVDVSARPPASAAAGRSTAPTAPSPTRPPAQQAAIRPPAPVGPAFRIVAFEDLPGWREDRHAEALGAIRNSCAAWRHQDPKRLVGPARFGTVGDWLSACQQLERIPAGEARAALERAFRAVRIPGPASGLVTGYYEPDLNGSRVRTERFSVPLYRKPEQWSGPLPTRASIVDGALAGRGLELVWVDSAIDAFFLEIQGSGRITLTDGTVIGVSYAGQNGHPYFAIGQALIQWGEVERSEMSMAAIRTWLIAHPERQRELKELNRSYVFFRERPADEVRGAAGVPLTAGRSLAVDPAHVPYGAPVWLDLRGAPTPSGILQRLTVAQDTGGAIRGAHRGDLFWGRGPQAADRAGRMAATGTQTVLVPTAVAMARPQPGAPPSARTAVARATPAERRFPTTLAERRDRRLAAAQQQAPPRRPSAPGPRG